MKGQRSGFGWVSGIKKWLTAAGLIGWKRRTSAGLCQYFHRRFADFREQAVYKTGCEQLYSHITRFPGRADSYAAQRAGALFIVAIFSA